jgi:2-amino-4-hydroxy-6-hydroxymethyldihydropteridine diphosphokinase
LFAVLGLGSNKGDSLRTLKATVLELQKVFDNLCVAPLFETQPLYITDQRRFLNTAAAGCYDGYPYDLLKIIHHIEAAFGRDRSKERRWGERTLDIDILLADSIVLTDPLLTIPHPRLRERVFALAPLLALLPDARDPVTGESYQNIFDSLPDQGVIKVE